MSNDQLLPNDKLGASAVVGDSIDQVIPYYSVEKPRTEPISKIYQSRHPVSGVQRKVIEREIQPEQNQQFSYASSELVEEFEDYCEYVYDEMVKLPIKVPTMPPQPTTKSELERRK